MKQKCKVISIIGMLEWIILKLYEIHLKSTMFIWNFLKSENYSVEFFLFFLATPKEKETIV